MEEEGRKVVRGCSSEVAIALSHTRRCQPAHMQVQLSNKGDEESNGYSKRVDCKTADISSEEITSSCHASLSSLHVNKKLTFFGTPLTKRL